MHQLTLPILFRDLNINDHSLIPNDGHVCWIACAILPMCD